METVATTGFTRESFEAFLEARSEPDWMIQQRRDAWESFENMSWPARTSEEWARTDTRLFHLDKFTPASGVAPDELSLPNALLATNVDLAGQAVSWNGRSAGSSLDESLQAQGVVFGSLAQLAVDHGDLIRPYLMQRAFQPSYDRYAALHASCWSGGVLLYVPRGVVIDRPLHLFSTLSNGGFDSGHVLVILDEGAEATLLTETGCLSESDEGLHCGGVELIVRPGAFLRYVSLQNWSQHVWHFAHQKALVHRDASLQWTVGALGSRLAKVNQHVALVEPGAYSQVNGTMFTEGRQHLAYHTLQHHEAPSCRSDFLYKAALQDKSRTVWRGMIKVDSEAQGTDGYQRNDNLLLSDAARADSIPGLEIEADDVRCTHGSTSGRVDEELIFYAMCRGYTRKEAVRMIVTGFFQQIFDRITIDSVRDALGLAIARRVREYA